MISIFLAVVEKQCSSYLSILVQQQSEMKHASKMLRWLAVAIFVLLVLPFQVNCQRPRNSQWFEDTIDEFLRQAQDTGEATDIQVSTCKISSQQLVATAQATAARVLKGVCNPSEIESRFNNLEVHLEEQLNVLKTMLLSLEGKITDQDQEQKRQFRRLAGKMAGMKKSSGSETGATITESTYTPAYIPSVPHQAYEILEDEIDSTVYNPPVTNESMGPRAEEIIKYNSTVYIENGKRVFSYYWVVMELANKLNNWSQKRALRSNSFYIYPGGYRMFMKIIPRYTTATMYIHAGITKGENDEVLEWPFQFKMRAQVLAQFELKEKQQDLRSRIWDPKELCSGSNWRKPVHGDNPECVGLGFAHDMIQSPSLGYVSDDRIIIKLTVYLD